MKSWDERSLRVRLTRHLVLWQLVALAIFAVIATIPLAQLTAGIHLDPRTAERIADAVSYDDGALTISKTADLARIEKDYPEFWYYVATSDGQHVEHGPIKEEVRTALDNISFISGASFGNPDAGPGHFGLIRTIVRAEGELRIAIGDGPPFDGFTLLTLLSNGYFVAFSSVLVLVLIIMIPVTLRRELRPLEHVAEQASTIDVDQRGIRLTEDKIPKEVQPLVHAINGALARLDDGIERRHRFMADAAHELRTPIAILQMRTELLSPGPERDQLQLDIARLSNLADQLLDLQRIDMGQFNADAFDLVDLSEEVVSDLAPLAIAVDGEIAFETAIETVTVRGDRLAIARALTNLIQNAITHSGRKARVLVSVAATGSVTVSDNGPGIPTADRQKIFDPFYRIRPNQTGTGLGLNLVQEIVWRHKGSVRVSDSQLGGAAFIMELGEGRNGSSNKTGS